jgi:hypothetical protein
MKTFEDNPKSWDFGTPAEIEEALERNKILAGEGFEIREPNEDEPAPILRTDKDIPTIEDVSSSSDIEFDYAVRYWAMFDIVSDLVDEIKYLKKEIKESKCK